MSPFVETVLALGDHQIFAPLEIGLQQLGHLSPGENGHHEAGRGLHHPCALVIAIDGGHQCQPAAAVLLHIANQHGIIDGQQQMLALFRLAGLAPGHQLRHQVARFEVGGLAIDVLHHQPLVIDEVGRGEQAVGLDEGGQCQPGMAGEEEVVEGLMEHPILTELIDLGADHLAAKAGFAGHAGEGPLQL